jgi:hypothetical protein
MSGITFEQLIAIISALVVPLLVAIAGKFWGDKKAERLEMVKGAIGIAYNVVNEIAAMTTTKIDDKAALALKAFRDALWAQGITPTPQEEDLAKLGFKAMHGAEKVSAAASPH